MGGSYSRYNVLTRLRMGAMDEERKILIRRLRHLNSDLLLEGPYSPMDLILIFAEVLGSKRYCRGAVALVLVVLIFTALL